MRAFIILILFIMRLGVSQASTLRIAVLDSDNSQTHSQKVLKLIKKNIKSCLDCEVKNFPIYDKKGNLTDLSFIAGLNAALQWKPQIINLSWNIQSTPRTQKIEKHLKSAALEQNLIIFAAAGENDMDPMQILKLEQTVVGQVPEILIIGEKNKKGYLAPRSNYGIQMLTALSSTADFSGSSASTALATSELALYLSKNKIQDLKLLRQKILENKKKATTQFPSIGELVQ